jgi:hypothetical protein
VAVGAEVVKVDQAVQEGVVEAVQEGAVEPQSVLPTASWLLLEVVQLQETFPNSANICQFETLVDGHDYF